MHAHWTGGMLLALVASNVTGGELRMHRFLGIPGYTVDLLTNHASFPHAPDRVEFIAQFENPEGNTNTFDNYGSHFLGYLTAPVTGNYRFYIASDDQSELYLSTDDSPANKVRIAREPSWGSFREFVGNPYTRRCPGDRCENASAEIPLVAGSRYFVEAVHKEASGGDHLSVTWQKPGDTAPTNGSPPISAEFLLPYNVPVTIATETPQDQTRLESTVATFTINITGSPHRLVTWFADGVPVAYGTNMLSYSTGRLRLSDNGKHVYAVVSNTINVVTSRVATLTVRYDNTPLQVVSAASFNGRTIGLRFNKAAERATASNALNYLVSGVSPTNAILRADDQSVLLELQSAVASPFTVRVENVFDYSGNPVSGPPIEGRTWAIAQDITPSGLPTRPNPPGSTNFTFNVGDADVIAGGADIWDTADEFHFIHNEVTGDFDVKVKVQRLDLSNRWAKGGIMARMSLAANSTTIQTYTTPLSATVAEFETGLRTTLGGGTSGWEMLRPSLPRSNAWIRLRRNGDLFRAYYGANGVSWNLIAERALPGAPSTVYLGLMTTSHNINQSTTCEYRNYSAVTYPGCNIGFSQDPQSQTIHSNGPVQFAATVNANIPSSELIYQWQVSTDGGGTFSNIAGANGTSYSIPYATVEYNANQLRLHVAGPGCSATSAAATLTLTRDGPPPRIRMVLGPVFGTNVAIYYSEAMADSATNKSAYQITDSTNRSITIVAAQFGTNNRTRINLTTGMDAPLVPGQQYTLTATASNLGGGLFAGPVDYARNPIDPNPTTITFTAQNINFDPDNAPTLPTTQRLPLGSLGDRGFDGRFVDIAPNIPNNNDVAEQMLAGTYTEINGNTVINETAVICWFEPNVINYNNDGGNVGAMPGDVQFPGLASGVDNLAAEILAYAELRAGLHSWAVDSDDGFRISPALSVNDIDNAITLGEFSGGRGSATTEFRFIAPEDGLYPIRLVYEEGQGGMNLEFWSRDLASGARVLINGVGGVPVYRVPLSVSPPANLSIAYSVANVIVSWPAASIGCLEGANSISGPWTLVRQATVLDGATKSITIPRTAAKRFYRHVRPPPALTR